MTRVQRSSDGNKMTTKCVKQSKDKNKSIIRVASRGFSGELLANVVNMRVCLRNTADFPAFNETFREFMQGEKVTRTCIGGTPHRAGVNVEIDCVAFLG